MLVNILVKKFLSRYDAQTAYVAVSPLMFTIVLYLIWIFAAMVAASDVVFDLIGDVLEGDLPNANLYYVAGAVVREFTSEFLSNITSGGERVQTG